MSDEPKNPYRTRFETTMELFEAGVEFKRQQLRREHPEVTEGELDRRLKKWLRTRPGAPYGDAEGRV